LQQSFGGPLGGGVSGSRELDVSQRGCPTSSCAKTRLGGVCEKGLHPLLDGAGRLVHFPIRLPPSKDWRR
jgi:hypothetical protein